MSDCWPRFVLRSEATMSDVEFFWTDEERTAKAWEAKLEAAEAECDRLRALVRYALSHVASEPIRDEIRAALGGDR